MRRSETNTSSGRHSVVTVVAGGADLDRLVVGGVCEECERSGRSSDGDDRAAEHQAPGAAGAVRRDAPAHVLPGRIGTGLAAGLGDARRASRICCSFIGGPPARR